MYRFSTAFILITLLLPNILCLRNPLLGQYIGACVSLWAGNDLGQHQIPHRSMVSTPEYVVLKDALGIHQLLDFIDLDRDVAH